MGWTFLMQCHGVQFMSLYAVSLYFHGHGMAGWQCQPHGMTGQDVAGPPTPDIGQAEESFLGGYLAELLPCSWTFRTTVQSVRATMQG